MATPHRKERDISKKLKTDLNSSIVYTDIDETMR